MVTDNIKNASLYYSMNENFKEAFEFLSKLDKNFKVGRYDSVIIHPASVKNLCT